ncbi:uncharacterized protein LOC141904118 [Tubulanus polymorphus]|uniref:uncharacterized protein LOC141904118 n=1 Tax=Tubulanus polymorphus TaxID=672921 RepID=UPI003DA31C65
MEKNMDNINNNQRRSTTAARRSRRGHKFKKGHRCYYYRKPSTTRSSPNHHVADEEQQIDSASIPIWQPRLDSDTHSIVTRRTFDGTYYIPDSSGCAGNAKILRPKPQEKDIICDAPPAELSLTDIKCVNLRKTFEMFNASLTEHNANSSFCGQPNFQPDRVIKWGLCWKVSVQCVACNWRGNLHKLYDEVEQTPGKPGPRAAAPNVGFQVGLQDCPIGNSRARYLLATTNVHPPARSGMQKTANKVGNAITELNESDMSDRRDECKRVNVLRGLAADAPINVQVDCRYNSISIAGRRKMGQNASQAIGICREDQSDKHAIIGAYLQTKLCPTGQRLRNKGQEVTCPGGHPNCTSNRAPQEPLSERAIGQQIGSDLSESGLHLKYATSDGDSQCVDGLRQGTGDPVERLADTVHLGQSQFRAGMKANFSDDMFPPGADKQQAKKMFALDVKSRCHGIYNELHRQNAGNIDIIRKKLPRIIDVMIQCYSGDCRNCRKNVVLCGGGRKTCWWYRSHYLSTYGLSRYRLRITDSDKLILRKVIEIKFGTDNVLTTRLNTNTNRRESANRSISVSLPKNVNYARNSAGRLASTIHRLNNAGANSAAKKLVFVGASVHPSSGAGKTLKQIERESLYHRTRQNQNTHDRMAIRSKLRSWRNHFHYKRNRSEDEYRKGMLDPQPNTSKACPVVTKKLAIRKKKRSPKYLSDHTYSRNDKSVSDHTYSRLADVAELD